MFSTYDPHNFQQEFTSVEKPFGDVNEIVW